MTRNPHFVVGATVIVFTMIYLVAVFAFDCRGITEGTLYAGTMIFLGMIGRSADG